MIEIPGMSPVREITVNPDGSAVIKITPPKFMGLPTQTLTLSKYDYEGYKLWQSGQLIQEALPHWTNQQCEVLMTGIGPEDWDLMFEEEEDAE